MKHKYLLFMSLFAPLFMSCNKDEAEGEDTSSTVSQPVAIQLTGLTIKESTVEALETATSRVSSNKWDANDRIGVFMLHDGTYNIVDGNVNKVYFTETGDGKFSPEGNDNTIYLPADGSFMDILAYYPYKELTDNIMNIDLSDQSDQSALDIMRGTPSRAAYNNAAPDIDMTFRHKMSQIGLTFQAGDGIEESELVGTKVILQGIRTTGTYDPVRDKLTIGDATGNIDLFVAEDGKSSSGVIMPENFKAQRSLVVYPGYNLNGTPFTFNISDGHEFLQGRSYNYTVTLYRDRLEVVDTSVTDWIDGGITEGVIIN